MCTSKVNLGRVFKGGNIHELWGSSAVEKASCVSPRSLAVNWNLLIQDVRWVVPSRSLEGDRHRP